VGVVETLKKDPSSLRSLGMTTKGRRERWWGATVRVWAKANLAEGAEAGRAQKPPARPTLETEGSGTRKGKERALVAALA